MLCVDNVYFPIVPEEESLTFESSNIKITNHSTKGVNYSIFFKKCMIRSDTANKPLKKKDGSF